MAHDIAYDSAKNETKGYFAKLLSLDMPLHFCITCNLELYPKKLALRMHNKRVLEDMAT